MRVATQNTYCKTLTFCNTLVKPATHALLTQDINVCCQYNRDAANCVHFEDRIASGRLTVPISANNVMTCNQRISSCPLGDALMMD